MSPVGKFKATLMRYQAASFRSKFMQFALFTSHKTSGVTTAPADPATQAGGARVGGPLCQPPKKIFHDIVVGDAAQFTSNCSTAGAALKGGGALCAGNAVALLVFGPVMP